MRWKINWTSKLVAFEANEVRYFVEKHNREVHKQEKHAGIYR